jgi:hypothetical protein
MNRIVRVLLVASFFAFTAAGSALAQCPVTPSTAVTTYHYDNLRTGWNCNETILTPAIVGSSNFGLLSTTTLDAQINAQPLFVSGQTITAGAYQGRRDVVYVATEANSIYAIDASNGNVLLHKDSASLGTPVWNPNLAGGGCGNSDYWVGINSTPAIDLANNVMYVIAYNQIGIFPLSSTKQTQSSTKQNQPTSQTLPTPTPHVDYYLHELDLGSLDDVTPPVLVSAEHLLDDTTKAVFDAKWQQQRPALLFVPGPGRQGNLYAGFGSFCDYGFARGWLLGWQTAPPPGPASSLPGSQLNNTQRPPGEASSGTIPWTELLSSIWMSGFGMAADAPGNLYFVTANSNLGAPTYDAVKNPANSVLKVTSDLTNFPTSSSPTSVLGFFTPSNHNALDAKDWDFGSGGVTLLPDQPGATPHLAVAAGKDGFMYLIDRDSLTGGTSAVALDYASIGPCFCGQSYFQTTDVGNIVSGQTTHVGHIVSSGGTNLMVWQVVTSPPASSQFPPYLTQETSLPVPQQGGDGGFFTSISSNGENDMIIWAVPRPVSTNKQVWLYAFKATQVPDQWSQPFHVRTELTQIFKASAGTWTNPLLFANANIVPVVANGRVFVASYGLLNIFGILPPPCVGLPCARKRAPTQVPGAPQTLKPPAGQASPHEVFGAIGTIDGSRLTILLRSGKLLQIDATTAIEQERTTELSIGRPVAVQGTYDAAGTLHADHIYRVKAPATWPVDR